MSYIYTGFGTCQHREMAYKIIKLCLDEGFSLSDIRDMAYGLSTSYIFDYVTEMLREKGTGWKDD